MDEKCEKCGEKATCFIYTDEGITCLCMEHYRTPIVKMVDDFNKLKE